jgi:hypothetical protein
MKSAVLVLVWCYKISMKENRVCEGTDCLKGVLRSGMTVLQLMVASASCVAWGNNEAVTLLYLLYTE